MEEEKKENTTEEHYDTLTEALIDLILTCLKTILIILLGIDTVFMFTFGGFMALLGIKVFRIFGYSTLIIGIAVIVLEIIKYCLYMNKK